MQNILTTQDQKLAALKSNSYFSTLDLELLLQLSRGTSLHEYQAGEVIYWQGEPCMGLCMVGFFVFPGDDPPGAPHQPALARTTGRTALAAHHPGPAGGAPGYGPGSGCSLIARVRAQRCNSRTPPKNTGAGRAVVEGLGSGTAGPVGFLTHDNRGASSARIGGYNFAVFL